MTEKGTTAAGAERYRRRRTDPADRDDDRGALARGAARYAARRTGIRVEAAGADERDNVTFGGDAA